MVVPEKVLEFHLASSFPMAQGGHRIPPLLATVECFVGSAEPPGMEGRSINAGDKGQTSKNDTGVRWEEGAFGPC